MAEEVQINPFTGKPFGAEPSIDTTTNDSPTEINPFTGKPFTYVAPKVTLGGGDMGRQMIGSGITSGMYTNRKDDDITKFTDYNVSLGQELDWEEIRAGNQSTAEQWGRGLAKAGVTTIGAVAENTLGVLFGIGSLVSGGAYYDNAIGRTVDKTNEWMRENMPNYLTREEQKMSTFQKLGTANFWADTVANGLGYSLGSIATMWLTGGMGPIGLLAKGIKGASKGTALYNTTKAIVNGTKLGTEIAKKASTLNRTLRASQVLEAGLMMSLAEASVEARDTQKNTYQSLLEGYMEENLLSNESEVPTDIKAQFEDVSYAAANTNFIAQLPVLASTNLMMFGKQVAGFNAATKESADVVLDGVSKKAISKFANETTWQGVMNRMKPVAMNGVEEAFQEGFQFASGEFAHSYHTDKLKNNGYGDMGKALGDALSKTFGTQEGLESMFVGLLTGGIMGGGQSVVNKDHSKRKANAQLLADTINTGFFDGATQRLGYANASSEVMKRMQAAKERNDINAYKDEQFKLISYNALQALEMGGYDVYRQKINDFGDLSDTEFAEAMGISLVNEKGETLTLEQAAGQSKTDILNDINSKIDNLEKVYKNVNDRFALPEPTRGLPRRLMGEEARKAEDQTYRERANLRNELVLKGAEVQDRTRRMGEVQKAMQETIDNSLAANNKMMSSELNMNDVLKDFSIYQTEPGEVDAKDYQGEQSYKDMLDRLNKTYAQLKKIDPNAAEKLKAQMQDYADLAADTYAALDAYNKLSSDPGAQNEFQKNLKEQQDATVLREQTKAFNEKFDNAETSEDVRKILEDDTLPESLKQKANAKELELKAKERKQHQKYLTQKGTSLEDKIANLKKIDKTKLNAIEIAGLNSAIVELERQLDLKNKGQLDVQQGEQQEDQVTDQQDATGEVQEAFDPDNLGGVQVISEDGRTFQIDGTTYYNKEANPNDAVKRTEKSKKIKYVELEDADGNRRRFIKQQADALAYAIRMSEARKLEGQPTLDREAAEAREKAAKERIKRLAFGGKHGNKTNDSLRSEIYELDKILDQLETDYDNLRYFFISEGATNKDINNEPEMRERKREINSLRAQIRARKGVLKLRGQSIGVSEMERIRIEGKAIEAIEESKEYKAIVENEITELEQTIETLDQSMQEYKNNDDFDSFKAASAASKQAQQKLEQKRKDLLNAEAQIALEENKLKGITNENETGLPEYGGQTTESTEGETQEQDPAREARDNRESAREEGTAVTPQYPDSAVTVKRQKFRIIDSDGNIQEFEIKTNLDGSLEYIDVPKLADKSIVQKDKLSAEDVVNEIFSKDKGYTVELLETTYGVEAGLNPKKYERLTPDQKRRVDAASDYAEDTAEPVGKNEKAIEKSVENNKRSQEAAKPTSSGKQGAPVEGIVVAEFDLTQPMPPVEGPTLGENLAAAAQPTQQTSDIDAKKADIENRRVLAKLLKQNEYKLSFASNVDKNKTTAFYIDSYGKTLTDSIEISIDEFREFLRGIRRRDKNKKEGNTIIYNLRQKIADRLIKQYDAELAALEQPTQQASGAPVQQRLAAVPPTEEEVDTKSAMSDRAIKDPATNRSQIEVTPAGSPVVNAPDTVDGEIIKMDREALIQIQPGVEVEFQIIENDYYKENFPNGSVADIPVYFKVGDQIVGKLQRGEGQDRAEIVRKLQAGERVTSNVNTVISPNFNNARTADGQKYFYDPRETFGGAPQLVGTVVTDGIVEFIGPSGSDLTMRTPGKTGPGQVGFLIPANQNPEGTDNVSMGSTANLNRDAVTAVGEALKQKNFDLAREIVANSDESRRAAAYSDPSYLEFGQFGSGQNYMVYNSPIAQEIGIGDLIRINDVQLQKALRNEPFKLNFVKVDQNGDYQTVETEDKNYNKIKDNFKKDFADFLGRKKYNVDLERSSREGAYTSPVNPNNTYDSYTDYLFSAQETGNVARQEGQGYNAILTTDVVRTSVGYFHNPVITFSKGNLRGTTVEEISENTTFASSKAPSVSDLKSFANEMGSPFASDLKRNDFEQGCKK